MKPVGLPMSDFSPRNAQQPTVLRREALDLLCF
jgi:hypothetical protein